MSRQLLVYGAGGHGSVIADAATSAGWQVVGFGDDDADRRGERVFDSRVVAIGPEGALSHCREAGAQLVLGIGDNRRRAALFDKLAAAGARLATVVHRSAVVAPSSSLGPGTVVFAGAVINPGCEVGANAIINTRVSIDHDNRIGAHAHISPGASLGGTVEVGEGTHIGIGAAVRNNQSIGTWTIVGAGGVVVHDLPDGVVAYGNPARIIRKVAS